MRIRWFHILIAMIVLGLIIEHWVVSLVIGVVAGAFGLVRYCQGRVETSRAQEAAIREIERRRLAAVEQRRAVEVADERRHAQRRAMMASTVAPVREYPVVTHAMRSSVIAVETEFTFDVALSFAGEDRGYAHAVAEKLRACSLRVFYDEYYSAEMWGEDLFVYLDEVYRKRARYVVAFVSRHYVAKAWTRHERQSAQARFLKEESPSFLPVRLDDSELPGLRPTVGYIDLRTMSTDTLAELIVAKLGHDGHRESGPHEIQQVPRTTAEEALLLATRPPAWEHLFFASVLSRERDRLAAKWRDHALGYVRPQGEPLTPTETASRLSTAFRQVQALASNIERIFTPDIQELAFGAPGAPGDVERIEHLAKRLIDVYEAFMDWAADLRNSIVPERFDRAIDLASSFADAPLRSMHSFVDEVVASTDELVARLGEQQDEPVHLKLTLTLDSDNDLVEQFNAELKKAERAYG